MIQIDGSMLQGGGQILRTAVALAAITKKDCRVFNVRRGRKKPGLAHQHLLGLQALSQFCNGRLEGDFLGSGEIKFYPGSDYQNKILINIPTAGSITLVLQALIPPALFAQSTNPKKILKPIEIIFDGGATDTFFSPTIDYFQCVFLKLIEKIGVGIELKILKRGYYPEGRAKVEVKISPLNETEFLSLKPLNLMKRGKFKKILAISGASEFLENKKVAERQLAGVREVLGKLKLPIEERVEYYQTKCPGSQICLICEFENTVIGADNLGKLGKRAEDVGREVALQLLEEERVQVCLDRYSSDQILPYLALVLGKSSVSVSRVTDHGKTNMWVIENFINGKFETKENLITWLPTT